MNDINEASARLLIEEFETRQAKEKVNERTAWQRWAVVVGWVAVFAAAGAYLQKGHILLSGTEACSLFIAYLIYSTWGEHQTQEKLRGMREELDELKKGLGAQKG